ncbi:hypothetical protein CSB09_00360 [Candidatus Gracilibacteria bacterium]|nr:MAG: hypothetical protein CSB09_00360 [Candidatus Gracilibacteria bacterium]
MTGKVIARNEVTWQSVGRQKKEEIAALRSRGREPQEPGSLVKPGMTGATGTAETKIPLLTPFASPFTKGAYKNPPVLTDIPLYKGELTKILPL